MNDQIKTILGLDGLRELLEAERYENIADFLEEAQAASEQKGYAVLSNILFATSQISRACGRSQDEVDWHKQAYAEAERRKGELKQALLNILSLVSEQEKNVIVNGSTGMLSQPEDNVPESPQLYRLWHSLQSLLKARIPSQPSALSHVPAQLCNGQPALIVYCLGPFEVYRDNQRLDEWPSRKGKLIFKYLVTHRKQHIPKEVLMDMFWPNVEVEAARNNLNVAIYNLRQTLRDDSSDLSHILFQDDCYFINPDLYIWTDFEEFQEHFRLGQQFEQRGQFDQAVCEYCGAESLYRGAFLEEDCYEEWSIPNRQHLQGVYFHLLECLSSYYLDHKNYGACVTVCSKMLTNDPCREDAHERLMRCYSRQGQPYLALRQYHLCVETLKKDLSTAPSPTTTALYQKILGGECV